MLHSSAVSPHTLELLKRLQPLPFMKDFYLAGGTALALHYGHRISVDLDFFTPLDFNPEEIIDPLKSAHDFHILAQSKNSLTLNVADVKVDFIRHDYPLLRPASVLDGIKLACVEDIAAMKLNAVKNRGSKKDFFDIHELLRHFSLRELIRFHLDKYYNSSTLVVLKSLVYFDDAIKDPEPISLTATTWSEVKIKLQAEVEQYEL